MVVHPVAGNVSYIEGHGGNIGLFTGPDGGAGRHEKKRHQKSGVNNEVQIGRPGDVRL